METNLQNGFGKCPACNSWNTFYEEKIIKDKNNNNVKRSEVSEIVKLNTVEIQKHDRYKTGIDELDRVLRRWISTGLTCTSWRRTGNSVSQR